MTNTHAASTPSRPPRTILFKVPHDHKEPATPVRPCAVGPDKPASPPSKSPTVRKLRRIMDGSEYKAFFQSLYDGVMITDIQGRMVDVNEKACTLSLIPRETLCGMRIMDVITGINEKVLASIGKALDTGRHVLVETPLLRSDGTEFPCEVAVTPLQIANAHQLCFSVRDMTDRVKTEQRLLAQEKELRQGEAQLRASLRMLQERERELARERDVLQALMDAIPDRIFFKNLQGRFLRINKAMASFHGLNDPVEAEGKSDYDFFDEAEANTFTEDDREVMEKHHPILDKIQEIQRPDGSALYSAVSKVLMRNGQGAVIGLVGISRDVTARVKAEKALKDAQKQLARVDRLEATALFAGQIAHDFNNLLVPLLIYPEMIKKHFDKDSQPYEDLEIIENTAQQIADINQDLMVLSRRGKVREQTVSLHAAVSSTLQAATRNVTEKRLDVTWSPEAENPSIKFDPPQLARVLHNLCQNAIDAVEENGRLMFKTENACLSEPFGTYVQISPGDYVKLTVADNGCGIPEGIKDKIFDPFFTTKSTGKKRGGSGLGLSVVYGIMSDHNSYVDVESKEGQGTTFSLYFPVCAKPAREGVPAHVPGGSESILVVEDEQLHSDVVSRLLTDLGYNVSQIPNGESAVKAMEASRDTFPDLILLDIMLGTDMDGIETFRRIRTINPLQKAISVSGMNVPERIEEGRRLGIGQHLSKPLRMEPLALAVRQELDRDKPAAPASGKTAVEPGISK